MGKRELVLIAAFVVLGLVVWQWTAPPADPNQKGFSLQRLISNLRTELAGQRVEVSLERQAVASPSPAVERFVIADYRGAVSVAGEDRDDVVVSLTGTAYGADPAETKALADKITVILAEEGKNLTLTIGRPEARRRPRLDLQVKLPRRLALRLAAQGERTQIRSVASVDATLRFSTAQIDEVPGEVKVEHRDGRLEVVKAGSVALLTRRSEVRVEQVAGRARIEASDDRLTLRAVEGPVSVETRRVEISADDLRSDLDGNLADGSFAARGVAGVVTLESLRCRVSVTSEGKAAVTITATDAPVDLTLPTDPHVTLDFDTVDGEIRLPADSGLRVSTREGQQSLQASQGGGGPLVKIRARRGGITLR